ncbi:flagellar hook-associated protein FlgL [Clostridium sp. A1-XYC3]|uniref:Flagellar hook-associated protein FlgL n=1 Tax=Clostridium tanneri TaxID=3037988 RepID=A0ABU4JNI5_9CLOT|nr:flagellar hook-associated protein FlgL [Clostridium sp. A1-XYC3]MDW8799704.1 flagellar hook-associated protein FlgL [Clostridium sp. A1-XYC3]
MRVTNKMLANNYLSDMQTNLGKMRQLQQQMSSGKNFSKPSDDPFNVSRSMQMHTQIDANKQYNKNITNVINWLDTTDTALGQLGNVFQSIREKMVSAGNAAYGSDERLKIKDEINQRIGQISQVLNTSFDGEYIFGGTKGASKPVNAELDSAQNNRLIYTSSGGKELKKLPNVTSETVTPKNWSGKKITFNIDGKDVEITLDAFTDKSSVDDVVNSINKKISESETGTPPEKLLRGKIIAEKSADGKKISFFTQNNDKVAISATDIDAAEFNSKNQEFPSMQMNMISGSRETELSQGVIIKYNVSAVDVVNYGNSDKDNIMGLMQRILNHLEGKDDNGNTDAEAGTKALTNQDLVDIDAAMSQILKFRSEVGAKQKRMEGAKEQNEQSNLDMTDILSKTEDIDITEKTMEYAVMQTVYLASLQTSAKVLQPTLMDYMR